MLLETGVPTRALLRQQWYSELLSSLPSLPVVEYFVDRGIVYTASGPLLGFLLNHAAHNGPVARLLLRLGEDPFRIPAELLLQAPPSAAARECLLHMTRTTITAAVLSHQRVYADEAFPLWQRVFFFLAPA
jgi:hypothetical protein